MSTPSSRLMRARTAPTGTEYPVSFSTFRAKSRSAALSPSRGIGSSGKTRSGCPFCCFAPLPAAAGRLLRAGSGRSPARSIPVDSSVPLTRGRGPARERSIRPERSLEASAALRSSIRSLSALPLTRASKATGPSFGRPRPASGASEDNSAPRIATRRSRPAGLAGSATVPDSRASNPNASTLSSSPTGPPEAMLARDSTLPEIANGAPFQAPPASIASGAPKESALADARSRSNRISCPVRASL